MMGRSLFRFARTYSAQAGTLYGVAAHPNPQPELISLYNRILHNVKAIPESTIYRQSVESVVNERLNIIKSESDISNAVAKINAGLAEELMIQAKDELQLITKMQDWKPWEPLEEPPVPGQWETVKV